MNSMPKPKILFVDDETFFAGPYVDALDAHFLVTIASDVETAEAEFRGANSYACAVLDVMMPIPESWPDEDKFAARDGKHTGIVILRRCHNRIVEAKIPIVVISYRHPEEVSAEIELLGFPSGLIEVRHKVDTRSFMLPNIVRGTILRAKDACC